MIGEHSTRGWNVDRDEGNQTTCRVSVKDKHDLMVRGCRARLPAPRSGFLQSTVIMVRRKLAGQALLTPFATLLYMQLASPQPAKEAPGTVVTIKSARQGLRVVRGPGWRHGDVVSMVCCS